MICSIFCCGLFLLCLSYPVKRVYWIHPDVCTSFHLPFCPSVNKVSRTFETMFPHFISYLVLWGVSLEPYSFSCFYHQFCPSDSQIFAWKWCFLNFFKAIFSKLILCMHPANRRRHYIVTLSLMGWVHTQNDPWVPAHVLLHKGAWQSADDSTNLDLFLLLSIIWGNVLWFIYTQIAKFIGPTWGPPGSCRPQLGPILAPWTLLSG